MRHQQQSNMGPSNLTFRLHANILYYGQLQEYSNFPAALRTLALGSTITF
jgi:hypothetical protein